MPTDHTGLVARLGRLTAAALAALVLCLAARVSQAQDILEDGNNEAAKHYLLTLSGQVGQTHFQSVRAILSVAASQPGSIHNYVITISGWPKTNGASTFAWNSEDSLMDSVSGRVTCRIVNSYSQAPNINFFYLSPALLKREGMLTQHEGARLREERRDVRPTMVPAQAGELTLNFSGLQVNGQVWINGYDPVQKAHVRYQATFQGELSRELKSTLHGGQFN